MATLYPGIEWTPDGSAPPDEILLEFLSWNHDYATQELAQRFEITEKPAFFFYVADGRRYVILAQPTLLHGLVKLHRKGDLVLDVVSCQAMMIEDKEMLKETGEVFTWDEKNTLIVFRPETGERKYVLTQLDAMIPADFHEMFPERTIPVIGDPEPKPPPVDAGSLPSIGHSPAESPGPSAAGPPTDHDGSETDEKGLPGEPSDKVPSSPPSAATPLPALPPETPPKLKAAGIPPVGPPPVATSAASDDASPGKSLTDPAVWSMERIEFAHQVLMNSAPRLEQIMKHRGVTEEFIKKKNIGYVPEMGAYSVPVLGKAGEVLNVRFHAALDKKKFGLTGRPVDVLYDLTAFDESANEIVPCEGEPDYWVLCSQGYNAITSIGGASVIPDVIKKNLEMFEGKAIRLVPDNDPAGKLCVAKSRLLFPEEADVKRVVWPGDFSGKDACDWFVKYGRTKADFVSQFQPYSREQAEIDRKQAMQEMGMDPSKEEILDLTLPEAAKAEFVGRRVRVPIHVIGKDRTPFQVIRKAKLTIYTKKAAEPSKEKVGSEWEEESLEKEFKATDPLVVQMIRCSETQRNGYIKQACGFGSKDRVKIEPVSHWNVEEVFVQMVASETKIYTKDGKTIYEVGGKKFSEEEVNRTIYVVTNGEFIRENAPAIVEGVVLPCSRNQYATIQVDKFETALTDVSSFTLSPALCSALMIFRPAPSQKAIEKLDEIARDLAANVSKRYGRTDLHILIDLILHSALSFKFRGEDLPGCVTSAAVGDTSQAKTTTLLKLLNHYSAGTHVSCETSARTGLKGAIESFGDHWLVKWGILPLCDGRFCALDEYGLLPEEDRMQLRQIFSEGIASIGKTRQAQTVARVRTLLLSNPKDQKKVGDFTHPFEALTSIFKEPDLRRLDVATVVREGDVSAETVNQSCPPAVPHEATSELCHALIMWAWSRKPQDIVFVPGAEEDILKAAKNLTDAYGGCIALVEAMSLRNKIARIAVAVAIRLFSTEDGAKVLVTQAHVEAAKEYLYRIYNAPNFALDLYAEQYKKDHAFNPKEIEDTLASILGPDMDGFLEVYQDGSAIRHGDLQSMMGWNTDTRKDRVFRLIRTRLLKSGGNGLQALPRLKKFAYEWLKKKKN